MYDKIKNKNNALTGTSIPIISEKTTVIFGNNANISIAKLKIIHNIV